MAVSINNSEADPKDDAVNPNASALSPINATLSLRIFNVDDIFYRPAGKNNEPILESIAA